MTGIAMKATLVAALLTLGMQAQAANKNAECVAGTVIGGAIGGLLGNGLSNGDAGATIGGAGLGALFGAGAACDNVNVGVDVNVNNGGGYDDGSHHGGGYHGHHGQWDDQDDQVGSWLIEAAFKKAFKRYQGYKPVTVVVESDRQTVQVTTRNEFEGRRGKICREFKMTIWNRWNDSDSERGVVCKDRRGNISIQ